MRLVSVIDLLESATRYGEDGNLDPTHLNSDHFFYFTLHIALVASYSKPAVILY